MATPGQLAVVQEGGENDYENEEDYESEIRVGDTSKEPRERTMNSNPFHPPQIRDARIDIVLDARQKAQRQVRAALLILLVPGLYNFICFQFFLGIGQFHDPFFSLSFGLNLLGILILADIVWFFGLSSLEGISARAHKFLARTSNPAEWLNSLYQTLDRISILAFLGAILWTIWVIGFYQLQLNFYIISVPIGIAAHLLAAALYLPLFYRWYQISRTSSHSL